MFLCFSSHRSAPWITFHACYMLISIIAVNRDVQRLWKDHRRKPAAVISHRSVADVVALWQFGDSRLNFQYTKSLFAVTKSVLFSVAWLQWPHMMNAFLKGERNRVCCYWCFQLITPHQRWGFTHAPVGSPWCLSRRRGMLLKHKYLLGRWFQQYRAYD